MKEFWKKLKDEKTSRELFAMLVAILCVVSIALLLVDVLGQSKVGRSQIVSPSTVSGTWDEDLVSEDEKRLSVILGKIQGVGSVDVMISWSSEQRVEGVIVVAEGASEALVRHQIQEAVSALYPIPSDQISVFPLKEQ